jgi:transposase
VEQLDVSAIESVYEEEERGQPPYHPRMMTKILIYGYCVGVFSSRRIRKKLSEDIGFRVLAAGNQRHLSRKLCFAELHFFARNSTFGTGCSVKLEKVLN